MCRVAASIFGKKPWDKNWDNSFIRERQSSKRFKTSSCIAPHYTDKKTDAQRLVVIYTRSMIDSRAGLRTKRWVDMARGWGAAPYEQGLSPSVLPTPTVVTHCIVVTAQGPSCLWVGGLSSRSPPPRISENQVATEHSVSWRAVSPRASPFFASQGRAPSCSLEDGLFCTPDAAPRGRKCQALSFSLQILWAHSGKSLMPKVNYT